MLNKKILATLLVSCLGCATAQADSVSVAFTTNVIGSSCILKVHTSDNNTPDDAAVVNFTDIKDNALTSTEVKTVFFTLSNCGAGVAKATVKAATQANIVGNLLKAEESSAKGTVNFAFFKDAAAQTEFNLVSESITFNKTGTDANNLGSTQPIYVKLQQASNPTIGAVNESIIFNAEYE